MALDLISSTSYFSRVVLQRAVVDPEERKGKNKMVRVFFESVFSESVFIQSVFLQNVPDFVSSKLCEFILMLHACMFFGSF